MSLLFSLSPQSVCDFLIKIDSGKIKLTRITKDLLSCYIVYKASNNWEIAIFNDAGEWDYLEWVKDNFGRKWEFPYPRKPKENFLSIFIATYYHPNLYIEKTAYDWDKISAAWGNKP